MSAGHRVFFVQLNELKIADNIIHAMGSRDLGAENENLKL